MKNFSYKFNDLELRSCGKQLLYDNNPNTANIVKWEDDACYTICYFEKDKEGYYLKFVGDRPLKDEIDWIELKKLIIIGYEKLTEYFDEIERLI
jgi:hypothetical protein